MAPTHILDASPRGEEPGAYITSLFRAGGPNTRVFLTPKSVWPLRTTIEMTDDGQELATLDYPDAHTDKAVLNTVGEVAGAISCFSRSLTRIRNLYIDGQEPKYGRTKNAESLVFLAGPGSKDALIENCVLTHTRGWTCCHVFDHGERTRVLNNLVGPSGHPAPDGPWADGISVACRNGIIAGNTVIDATDGGIVVFCAPGSLIVNNTIIARERDLLGGINMVDKGPYDGDYTSTRVYNNRIRSEGAFIKLGIGIGSRPWGDGTGIGAYGGLACDNQFGPGNFGYGCKDMIVRGNSVRPDTVFLGNTDHCLWNPAAQPFVARVDKDEPGGELQDDFIYGHLGFLIGILRGAGSIYRYYRGGLRLTAGQSITLRNARLELQREGQLILWDAHASGRVLWSTPRPSRSARKPEVRFTDHGVLEIFDVASEEVVWSSGPSPPAPWPGTAEQDLKDPSVFVADHTPYLVVRDASDSIAFTTSAAFPSGGWDLKSGQYICMPSSSTTRSSSPSGAPIIPEQFRPAATTSGVGSFLKRLDLHDPPAALRPLPPSRTTWLVLDPSTSSLILHSSASPLSIDSSHVHWRSPNSPSPLEDHRPAAAVLQGDGNLVIYHPTRGAIWASATNGPDPPVITQIALYAADDHGGARLELQDAKGRMQWTTATTQS